MVALAVSCSAVMRITARMPVLRMRIRITRPRIRMRMSGLANDFQKGKNINFESNDPASRQKISPQKGVSRRFRASRTAERPEYEKQSVEMKRIGNLYEKIISLDNLRLADEKARRGKLRSYGVLLHDKNREANILALHETLKNRTFKNSEYSTFTIYEPREDHISIAVLPRPHSASCDHEYPRTDMGFGLHERHV